MLPHKAIVQLCVFGGLGRKPLKPLFTVVIVDHSVMKAMEDHWHWCSLETLLTFPDCPLGACRGSPNLLRAMHCRERRRTKGGDRGKRRKEGDFLSWTAVYVLVTKPSECHLFLYLWICSSICSCWWLHVSRSSLRRSAHHMSRCWLYRLDTGCVWRTHQLLGVLVWMTAYCEQLFKLHQKAG